MKSYCWRHFRETWFNNNGFRGRKGVSDKMGSQHLPVGILAVASRDVGTRRIHDDEEHDDSNIMSTVPARLEYITKIDKNTRSSSNEALK